MSGGCTHAIMTFVPLTLSLVKWSDIAQRSIETCFQEWSKISFIEAIGKQVTIMSFLLNSLIVPVEFKDTMSNQEKDEWKLWGDTLCYALDHDNQELELYFGQAVSAQWKMRVVLQEVLVLPPKEITVVIDVVESVSPSFMFTVASSSKKQCSS